MYTHAQWIASAAGHRARTIDRLAWVILILLIIGILTWI